MTAHRYLPLLTALMLSAGVGAALAQDAPLFEYRRLAKTLVVQGDGGPLVANLQLSTQSIDFGSVATNTTETRQVLATNSGDGLLSWSAAPAVSGSAAYSAGNSSCGASLAAGASCTAEVTFTPTTLGTFNGALTFTSTLAGSPHEVSLVGTAFNPVSLASAALPPATVGQAYSFDFKPLLGVSNEAIPDRSLATWSVAAGTLPAGLSINNTSGMLSGTPTAPTTGASFTVRGVYKSNPAQQTFSLLVDNGQAALAGNCRRDSANQVWCMGVNNSDSGALVCGYPGGYSGAYYAATSAAASAWGRTLRTVEDCATNYTVNATEIVRTNLSCWTNQQRWGRTGESSEVYTRRVFVRCTNME